MRETTGGGRGDGGAGSGTGAQILYGFQLASFGGAQRRFLRNFAVWHFLQLFLGWKTALPFTRVRPL